MDTTDWLKGIVQEDSTMMDSSSSSSPSTELISCPNHPPPTSVLERRLRPPQDQALKCPRCDSTHTKFCYYNNYSLSQPRYFCKTCRRYWTKGGSLRNVPVGGGCRKNRRPGGAKKPAVVMADHATLLHQYHQLGASAFADPTGTDLHLSSFSGALLPPHNLGSLSGTGHRELSSLIECNYDGVGVFDGTNPYSDDKTFMAMRNPMRTQLSSCIGGGGGCGLGSVGCYGDTSSSAFHGMLPVGFSIDGGNAAPLIPTALLPSIDAGAGVDGIDAKPNGKLLSLEWQDQQGCSDVGRESFGYTNGVGIWNAPSSTSNPLV